MRILLPLGYSRHSPVQRYAVAVVATVLGLLLRRALWAVLGDESPFLLCWPAVLVSAWVGGLGPGLFASALCGIGATYFLIPPHGSLVIGSPQDVIALLLFLSVSFVFSLLCETVHQSGAELETRVTERTTQLSEANRTLEAEVTERKRAEETLRGTAEEVADLYNRAPCGYHSLDPDGTFARINDTELSWLGYRREELVGRMKFADLLTEESRGLFEAAFPGFMERGWVRDLEFQIVRQDGSTFWALLSATAIRDAEGAFVASRASVLDITERMQAQQTLQRLAAIVESSEDAIDSKSLDGVITSWNRGAEALYGYSAEEAVGRHISMLIPPGRPDESPEILARVGRGEKVDHCETLRVTKDGRLVDVSLTLSPIKDARGRITGASAITRDVSLRKQAERALREAKEAAEAATRAKSEFLAHMSHEIRTPMNGILGVTDLLLDTDLPPESRHYLGLVKSSANSLLTVIDDILDFSKIEARKLQVEHVPFDLRALLDETVRIIAPRAAQKGLVLTSAVSPEVPASLLGDPHRLRQVLLNLLGNAIKFTERGEVRVEVEAEAAGDGALCLRLSVTDTGIGIPPERADAIFEAFSQAERDTTRKYGGTGLGLTISTRLAELMGGRLWLERSTGQGSTFRCTVRVGIPDPASEAAPLATQEPAPARPLRILLAEDDPINQLVARRLLEKHGHSVAVVESGPQVLQALERERFDLVLMDVQMPGMSGIETAAAIRQREAERGGHVPIVALTAYAMQGDRERCLAAGMDGYATKPLRPAELFHAIGSALPAASTDDGALPPGAAAILDRH
ncbi:MAG TPA: PAS domain S-box protein, partial [Armatimonadota bacterium]|nr:PAS domain S-box protein [Armatimonadota bacterium]